MKSSFRFIPALAAVCLEWHAAEAQIVIGGDPRVKPEDFVITTFADSLNYPVGMALLADGSILVAVSNGPALFSSTSGSLIRLVDSDDDGVAESLIVLVDDVPGGGLTALRIAGHLAFTTGQGRPITIYRLGAKPSDKLTEVGGMFINYSGGWLHPHSALAVRSTPGKHGSHDLFFQLGSAGNFAKTTRTLFISSTIGVEGTLNGDAIYNEENPLVYVDLKTETYFHFIGIDQPNVGHLDGLLAIDSSLFVADVSPGGGFTSAAAHSGVIYRIRHKPTPTKVKEAVNVSTPIAFSLSEAWPNPFCANTTIKYQLSAAADVVLAIYNVGGQKIATLVNQRRQAGFYTTRWGGTNDSGEPVTNGIYFLRMQAGDFVQTKRVLLLK